MNQQLPWLPCTAVPPLMNYTLCKSQKVISGRFSAFFWCQIVGYLRLSSSDVGLWLVLKSQEVDVWSPWCVLSILSLSEAQQMSCGSENRCFHVLLSLLEKKLESAEEPFLGPQTTFQRAALFSFFLSCQPPSAFFIIFRKCSWPLEYFVVWISEHAIQYILVLSID